MSLHRKNPRRDANEAELVSALREWGAEVWYLSGKGLPDLLVRYRGRYFVGEVKTKKGKETKHQGQFPIWRTYMDALETIGVCP
jgi:Holliday junction resolvase